MGPGGGAVQHLHIQGGGGAERPVQGPAGGPATCLHRMPNAVQFSAACYPPSAFLSDPKTCASSSCITCLGLRHLRAALALKDDLHHVHASHGQQAKQLLKRYGSAYLITSISFAIVSFAACYALVSSGVAASYTFGPAAKLLLE